MGTIHVLIVDEHPVVRDGLLLYITQTSDVQVVGQTGRWHEVLTLVRQKVPDVVILEAMMSGVKTDELVCCIKNYYPSVKIIVFSAYDDPVLVRGLFEAGVDGYILKEEELIRLIDAVREVMCGGFPLSGRVASIMRMVWCSETNRSLSKLKLLTNREMEVLQLMVQGLSNREIAEKLFITERTVKFHVGNILGKLGARTRVEAVRIAIEKRLAG